MTEEYEPLKVELGVLGTKTEMLEWTEKFKKIINETQTPKIKVHFYLKEIKPTKSWKP